MLIEILRRRLRETGSRQDELDWQLFRAETEHPHRNPHAARIALLEAELRRFNEYYNSVVERIAEIDLGAETRTVRAIVVSAPSPVGPRIEKRK